MSRKKQAALLLAALMTVGTVAGCESGTAEPQSGSSAQEPEAVTMTFLRAGTDEITQNVYEELIAGYEEEHSGVTIEYQQVNFGTDLETKLNTLYAGGSAPDLVRAPISTIALRASMGQYAELDGYIENWSEKDNYLENAYEVGSYNGKQYGLPINIDAQVLFYRKDYFEEAGLDPDSPPKTWEELLEYAEKLTVREGDDVMRAGFSFPISGEHQTLIPFARQNGSLVVDEENNKPVFNDEKTVEALEYLMQYADKNLIIPYVRNKDQNPFLLGERGDHLWRGGRIHHSEGQRDRVGGSDWLCLRSRQGKNQHLRRRSDYVYQRGKQVQGSGVELYGISLYGRFRVEAGERDGRNAGEAFVQRSVYRGISGNWSGVPGESAVCAGNAEGRMVGVL